MAQTLFIQIRCEPGTSYAVSDEIGLRELHLELYSVSDNFDLLLKMRVSENEEIGRYINDNLLNIKGSYGQIPYKPIKCSRGNYQNKNLLFVFDYS